MTEPGNSQVVSSDPKSILDSVLNQKTDELMPWEEVQLPSRGIYYDGLIPEGYVQVRPMGLHVDKILSTQRLARTGASIDWLYKHCVKLPDGFDHLDLLTGDRIFLLYYLRGITHGPDYEFIMTCPSCEQTSVQEYNLMELSKTIQSPDPMIGPEPFTVILPYLSQKVGTDFWVKVRFLRGRDAHAMMGTRLGNKARRGPRNRSKKKLPQDEIKDRSESLDETLERNLNLIIVEAMTETDRGKIQELVRRMHSSDIAAVREFLNDKSPGIDTIIETDCEKCGETVILDLPVTDTFFRPKRLGHDGDGMASSRKAELHS